MCSAQAHVRLISSAQRFQSELPDGPITIRSHAPKRRWLNCPANSAPGWILNVIGWTEPAAPSQRIGHNTTWTRSSMPPTISRVKRRPSVFPAIASAADSLCRLIEYSPEAARIPSTLIDQHVDAVRAIHREHARSDAKTLGRPSVCGKSQASFYSTKTGSDPTSSSSSKAHRLFPSKAACSQAAASCASS